MSIPAHDTGRVRSGDVELFYRGFGQAGKTPLLIAHGLSYFSYDWIEPAAALATDRTVVAADTRGFGDSDWSASGDYGVPTLARDLVTLLDHLRWPRVILVGHSMSGRATSLCAAEHPDRVSGLALIDYTPENAPAGSQRVTDQVSAQPDVFASVEAAMRYFGVDPGCAEGAKKRERFAAYLRPVAGGLQLKRDLYFRNQFKRAKETGERSKLGVDMWQVIGRVQCPILSMRGARSDMYASATAEKMKAANSRVRVVEVDAGHNVAGENLTGFLAALKPFIAAVEG
jgi:pimeloyl-ACP methyl ester carboxylesterase